VHAIYAIARTISVAGMPGCHITLPATRNEAIVRAAANASPVRAGALDPAVRVALTARRNGACGIRGAVCAGEPSGSA
jgi:hypothetical protein